MNICESDIHCKSNVPVLNIVWILLFHISSLGTFCPPCRTMHVVFASGACFDMIRIVQLNFSCQLYGIL